MPATRSLKIGITGYPSIGGSGILASALGEELAARGHEVHFISYERPFRLPSGAPRLHFHPVTVSSYGLFKYPDYTLPLSVKMAEVSREYGLDVLHVHYAVPHATAAFLARSMLGAGSAPRLVTTLHGTDTTLLGKDPGYGPAIRHALAHSDAVTTVSGYLERETRRLLDFDGPIDVIHNFFSPKSVRRTREEVRAELGFTDEVMILHASNLRPVKRIELLLETLARVRSAKPVKLVVLAGADFSAYRDTVRKWGISDRVVVRENATDIEDYLQAADLGLFTSETESFCLSILEAMCFGCPSVSTAVGGIPEVVVAGESGVLVHSSDPESLARAVESLVDDPPRRGAMGEAARRRALQSFSADAIVPAYERLYHRVCDTGPRITLPRENSALPKPQGS
jgi:N-acetyl-alpha-D-glucosaminyl L-malate synthase BshA